VRRSGELCVWRTCEPYPWFAVLVDAAATSAHEVGEESRQCSAVGTMPPRNGSPNKHKPSQVRHPGATGSRRATVSAFANDGPHVPPDHHNPGVQALTALRG
jgi:hypothetical protein